MDYKNGATDLLNLTYNYNQTVGSNTVSNGQIRGITDARGNAFSTSYSYDLLGRLAQAQTLDLTAANTWATTATATVASRICWVAGCHE